MTSKQFLYLVVPLVGFIVFLGFCVPKQKPPVTPVSQVKSIYRQYITELDSAVVHLKKVAVADQSAQDIQVAFDKARLAYKKVEYIAEYYNPYTAKAINGPPIDEVEEDDPLQKIVPPTGFQVIEELLFPEYQKSDKEELLRQIGVLKASVNRLRLVEETTEMTDAHIFDAMRRQVFRILTLGISGFDSPIAMRSMPEAASAFIALQQAFDVYNLKLTQLSPKLSTDIEQTFTKTIDYLQANPDFITFDRARFITQYANPLSGLLLDAQKTLGIPPLTHLRALTSDARTLFDTTAFNPNFYAPSYEAHLTPQKAALGKLLFFDPVLSGNGSRSCASCHQPQKAFTDGQAKSVAFDFKGAVSRNAPTMLNAGLQSASFHDLRVMFLEDQASDVLANASEMHGSLAQAVSTLAESPDYVERFKHAFSGEKQALSERNLKIAIASYVRSLTSLNARFDKYMRGDKTQMSTEELKGFTVFMGKAKCGTCHFMPLFNGTVPPEFNKTESEILGVPADKDTLHARLDADLGKYALYNKELHKFAFKTPTLRNVALTAPYMHNGVYNTLEEVIDFYDRGGGQGLGIDIPTQTLPSDKLHLTTTEKKQLVAFMHTLTDTTGLTHTPRKLPAFTKKVALNNRKIGGKY